MARSSAKKGPAKKVKRVKDLPAKTRNAASVKGGCQNNLLPASQVGQSAVQLTREAANK